MWRKVRVSPLIPDHALVVEELGYLGVPVARHSEGGCTGKVVLLIVLAHDIGTFVHAVTLVVDLTLLGIKSAAWGLVDEVVPVSVEGGDGAVVYAHQKRLQLHLGNGFDSAKKAKKQNADLPKKTVQDTRPAKRPSHSSTLTELVRTSNRISGGSICHRHWRQLVETFWSATRWRGQVVLQSDH
jgi:hypothetical protein